MPKRRVAEQQQDESRQAERQRPDQRSGAVASLLLGLQQTAGNAAVVQRLLGEQEGDGGDAPASRAPTGRCGGAVLAGTSVEEGAQGPQAEPLSAGGVATRQLTWSDFADADEAQDLDALTGYSLSLSGTTFTAAFSAARSWAKPSAKAGAGQAGLLRHEQYHLDLAVLMAQRATAAGPANQAGMNTLIARAGNQTRRYDAETAHGTNATQQAAWEAAIDGGTVPYA